MQDTISAPAATDSEKVGKVARLRSRLSFKVGVIAASLMGFIAGPAAAAHATGYTDPTSGAGSTFITSLKGFFLNSVVGEALGLMVVVLSISVLVSWGRKAIKSR